MGSYYARFASIRFLAGRKISNLVDPSAPSELELELELIQSHMAQKPMLRGEVGARVRVIRA